MIQNIWAVGRNYAAHAKELGHAVTESPMIFLKAGSTAVRGSQFHLPAISSDIHHEIEIALRFGPDLQFDAFALALDLTARDRQTELKSKGHPWTLAKSFRESCPLSTDMNLPPGPVPRFQFELRVNNEVRQRGDTNLMVFDCETLRRYVIASFPVVPGDYLLTGTPEGVGPIKAGDRLSARAISSSGLTLDCEWHAL